MNKKQIQSRMREIGYELQAINEQLRGALRTDRNNLLSRKALLEVELQEWKVKKSEAILRANPLHSQIENISAFIITYADQMARKEWDIEVLRLAALRVMDILAPQLTDHTEHCGCEFCALATLAKIDMNTMQKPASDLPADVIRAHELRVSRIEEQIAAMPMISESDHESAVNNQRRSSWIPRLDTRG